MHWRDWLIIIPIFWFLLGIGITALLSDPVLSSDAIMGQDNTFDVDTSDFNVTDLDVGGSTGGVDLIDTLKVMFGFSIPESSNFPVFIASILSFVNWLLVIIFGISIYVVANPVNSS